MTTYSELQTQIRDYTETSSDVLTDSIINDFIEHAEKRIFREVDLDVYRSYQYASLTQGNRHRSIHQQAHQHVRIWSKKTFRT